MEGISRKDLDRISQILANHVSTDESIQLAKKLTEFDFIPKMYAYTYLKRFYQEIKDIKSTDLDELPVEEYDGLDLEIISPNNLSGIKRLLKIAFEREDYFCDFDDSRFHGQIKSCQCQSEQHMDNIDPHEILSEEDFAEFSEIQETKDWDTAIEKFLDKLNLVTICSAFYYPHESTKKYADDPEWCCKICGEAAEGGDEEFDVSCDMEIGE